MNVESHPLLDRLAADYVLGVMQPGPKRRLEAAMLGSRTVRDAVDAWAERLHLLSRVESDLEPSPQLYARIEQRIERAASASAASSETRGRWWTWLRPAAGFALGVLLTSTVIFMQQPEYEALTSPARAPAVHGPTLHVLFAPGTTVEQCNAALRAIGGSIVDGPSAMGVLTVAIPQAQPIEAALQTLRAQPGVRFAEPASAPTDKR